MTTSVQKILIAVFLVSHLSSETAAAAIERPFKCGNLECPNGSFCEIKEKTSDDWKTVIVTTQCTDADGGVLAEETRTETVPEGKIPFNSIRLKSVNGGTSGVYYAESSIASMAAGGEGTTDIDFVPIDVDTEPESIWFDFDKLFENWVW